MEYHEITRATNFLSVKVEATLTTNRGHETKHELTERSKVDWNRMRLAAASRIGLTQDCVFKCLGKVRLSCDGNAVSLKGQISGKPWVVEQLLKVIGGDEKLIIKEAEKNPRPWKRIGPSTYVVEKTPPPAAGRIEVPRETKREWCGLGWSTPVGKIRDAILPNRKAQRLKISDKSDLSPNP